MQLIIYGFIILANVIALLSVYYSFGKEMDKNKRLLSTMITIGVVFIAVSVVYFFSSLGIEKNTSSDLTKNLLTTSFVPVIVLVFAPFLIRSYSAMKNNGLSQEKFKKRATVMFFLFIISMVIGFFYFRVNQKDIIKRQKEAANNTNNVVSNNVIEENKINDIKDNNIVNNEINNVISNNETVLNNNVEGNIINNAI